MKTEETPTCEIDGNLLANFANYNYPKDFDCGLEVINSYFKGNLKRALKSENVSGIGAISAAGDVMGFCTLTFCDIEKAKVRGAIPDSNLPASVAVMRLVMLGVDSKFQGLGIGRTLLKNALIQASKIHKQVPIKGLYLDAAPKAVKFYESLGFKKLCEPDEHGSTPMILGINVIMQAV
jgi:GNAT superfamily N-acetyltransferase